MHSEAPHADCLCTECNPGGAWRHESCFHAKALRAGCKGYSCKGEEPLEQAARRPSCYRSDSDSMRPFCFGSGARRSTLSCRTCLAAGSLSPSGFRPEDGAGSASSWASQGAGSRSAAASWQARSNSAKLRQQSFPAQSLSKSSLFAFRFSSRSSSWLLLLLFL